MYVIIINRIFFCRVDLMQVGKIRQNKLKTHPTKSNQEREREMNSIFSIDDFSDPFWESSPPLDSDSAKALTAEEWTVEMFFEEIASSVTSAPVGSNNNNNAIVGVSSAQSLPSVSGQNDFEEDSRFLRRDSDDYRRVLENKLETECAATVVALTVYLLFLSFFILHV